MVVGGAGDVARNGEAQRQPAPRFIGIAPQHGNTVVRLRLRLVAHQVEGEAAIDRDLDLGRAILLGAGEVGERARRVAHRHRRRGHAGFGLPAARADFLGAAEEADRRLGVAGAERGPTGGHQRREVPGIEGDQPDIARQRGLGRFHRPGQGRIRRRRGGADILRRRREGGQRDCGHDECRAAGTAREALEHENEHACYQLAQS